MAEAPGVKKAAAVLALLPSDADNLYVTVTAKALNPSVRIIARTLDERGELKLGCGALAPSDSISRRRSSTM